MEKNDIKINNKIRIGLILLFVLSLASIYIALMVVAISVESSPIPNFPFTMVEHMWKFFLIVPIPLSSVVLGLIFIQKGYKCKKNIIGGAIMAFLLCIYGSFTGIFASQISHDTGYLNELSEKIHFDFPDSEYISIAHSFQSDNDTMVMVKVEEKAASDFVETLNNDTNWKRDTSLIPSNAIDLFTIASTMDYEYFTVYNLTTNSYNNFNGQLIYMAFDVDTNVIYIYGYN